MREIVIPAGKKRREKAAAAPPDPGLPVVIVPPAPGKKRVEPPSLPRAPSRERRFIVFYDGKPSATSRRTGRSPPASPSARSPGSCARGSTDSPRTAWRSTVR